MPLTYAGLSDQNRGHRSTFNWASTGISTPWIAARSNVVPIVAAFSTRAIIPANIDDQGVIEFAQVFNGLNHPANLMVRVGGVGAEYFRLVGVHLLLRGH